MNVSSERILRAGRRTRIRLASALVSLGAWLHVALADLGYAVGPELFGRSDGRRRAAWPGLVVVALLVAGLAFVGAGGVWAIREALPQRETAP